MWGPPAPITPPSGATSLVFTDVSCVDAKNCLAVGYSNNDPVVMAKLNGVWGNPTVITVVPGTSVRFADVSCVQDLLEIVCVTVGQTNTGPFALALGNLADPNSLFRLDNTFPDRPAPYNLVAVDCVDRDNCVAVGTANDQPLYTVFANDAWSAPTTIVGPGASTFTDVNCFDAATCTAVGTATLMDGSKESFYVNRSAGLFDLSTNPLALPNGIGGEVLSLDCISSASCTAVGVGSNNRPFYIAKSGGSWGTGVSLPLPNNAPPYAGTLNDISCVDESNCTAVGFAIVGTDLATQRPVYARMTAGAWDASATLLADDAKGGLEAVSCTHPGNCTAVGVTTTNGVENSFTAEETNVLTITATSDSVIAGSAIPAIVPAYNGFITGESEAALTTPPTCTTTATASSPVGTYDTICSGAAALNYSITYVNGTINIVPPPQPPAFTSAASANFTVGTLGTFQVTGTGEPPPTFLVTVGQLPGGVTLSSAGLLSGRPNAGTAGTYNFTITASNGELPDATQAFTLTVNDAPAGGGVTSGGCNNAMGGISGSEIPIALMMIAFGIVLRLRRRQPARQRRDR